MRLSGRRIQKSDVPRDPGGRPAAGLLLLLGLFASGCSTSALRVQTVPEGAEIYLIRGSSPPARIGKSPQTLDSQTAPDLFSENLELRVEKDGFQSVHVVLPRSTTISTGRVSLQLKESRLPESCVKADAATNDVARGVAEVQSLIQRRKYEDAERRAKELTGKYGTIAVFHMLLGNALYLRKELPAALAAYRKAKELEPGNLETGRMIEKIARITGSTPEAERAPAGGN